MEDKINLLYFTASWCGPCRMMKPVIENFIQNNSNRVSLTKIDIDQNYSYAKSYNINSVPTFLVFKNGNIIDRFSGTVGIERLNKILN